VRPALEVADIFRRHGAAYRDAHAGHLSRDQRRVMAAIEACRTAALGGHVEMCEGCGEIRIAYNSCRNRHCPKCQGSAAAQWLADRQAELLPVPYFHLVFTLPAPLRPIAFHNKELVYGLLFKAAAESLRLIAADPQHLGAQFGAIAVLHTWGQNLHLHPHVHCIVPGGGPAPDGRRWVACRPRFFLPVPVLKKLFRRLFLEGLQAAFEAGKLRFFADLAALNSPAAFTHYVTPLRRTPWVVYAKAPFAGPQQVLAYLARYTHRVAIANSRLLALNQGRVRFRWKDYRDPGKPKVMTLTAEDFIRRFLLHILPEGFHRIRHYGYLANGHRAANLALCRQLLAVPKTLSSAPTLATPEPAEPAACPPRHLCPDCGGRMLLIAVLPRALHPPCPHPWNTS
jgi:hypothetical protein